MLDSFDLNRNGNMLWPLNYKRLPARPGRHLWASACLNVLSMLYFNCLNIVMQSFSVRINCDIRGSIYKEKIRGHNTEPCGTPYLYLMRCLLFWKQNSFFLFFAKTFIKSCGTVYAIYHMQYCICFSKHNAFFSLIYICKVHSYCMWMLCEGI